MIRHRPAPDSASVAAAMRAADPRNRLDVEEVSERLSKGFGGYAGNGGTAGLRFGLRAAVPGGWASDHYEETLHNTEWNYVATHTTAMQCSAATVEVRRPKTIVDSWTGKCRRPSQASTSKLYKSHDQDSDDEHDILPEDFGLNVLLNRPNPSQSGASLRYETSTQLSLTGTALIVKIRNSFGKTVELYLIPTALMTPRPPDSRYPMGAYYVAPAATRTNWADDSFVSMVGWERLSGATIDARDVIRISLPHAYWKDEGYSPLAAGSMWSDGSEQIGRSRFAQFKNGPDPSFYLEPPADVNPTDNEIERVMQLLEAKYAGSQNTGKVFVGPGGTKLTALSTTPKEMAYTEGFDQLRNALMGIHGVPLIAAGITDGGSYAAFYAALKQFITLTVQPRLDWIAEAFTMHLAPEYGEGLIVRLTAKSVDDPAILESRLATDIQGGWIKINEGRKIRGLPPDPEGEVWAGRRISERVAVDGQQAADAGLAGGSSGSDERATGIDTGQKRPFDDVRQTMATVASGAQKTMQRSAGFDRLARAASSLWNGHSNGEDYP